MLSFFLRAGAVTVFSSLALLRISSSITWRVLLLLALLLGCPAPSGARDTNRSRVLGFRPLSRCLCGLVSRDTKKSPPFWRAGFSLGPAVFGFGSGAEWYGQVTRSTGRRTQELRFEACLFESPVKGVAWTLGMHTATPFLGVPLFRFDVFTF